MQEESSQTCFFPQIINLRFWMYISQIFSLIEFQIKRPNESGAKKSRLCLKTASPLLLMGSGIPVFPRVLDFSSSLNFKFRKFDKLSEASPPSRIIHTPLQPKFMVFSLMWTTCLEVIRYSCEHSPELKLTKVLVRVITQRKSFCS